MPCPNYPLMIIVILLAIIAEKLAGTFHGWWTVAKIVILVESGFLMVEMLRRK